MWFKNLLVYQITKGTDAYDLGEFEVALDERPLVNPSPINMKSTGWLGVVGERRMLVVGGQILVALGTAERQLPPAVIKSELKAREKLVAAEQGFPVGKRQRRELKQKVTDELMPKALIKVRSTQAWIDTIGGYLVVNTSSPARAEEVVTLLRDTHPEFKVAQLQTERNPQAAAAAWMTAGAPGQFTLEDRVELQALDKTKATAKYARLDISNAEITSRLTYMQVMKLGMSYSDRVTFVLTENLVLRKVELLGISEEKTEEKQTEEDKLVGDFILMTGELGKLIASLVDALGGVLSRG